MNSLQDIPYNVLIEIFRNLNACDLSSLMQTCKYMYSIIIGNNSLWAAINRRVLTISERCDSRCGQKKWSEYNKFRISYNWRHGVFKQKLFRKGGLKYMPWIIYDRSQYLNASFTSWISCYKTDKKGYPQLSNCSYDVDLNEIFNCYTYNDITRFIVKEDVIVCGTSGGIVAALRRDKKTQRLNLCCYMKDCFENDRKEVTAVECTTYDNTGLFITSSQYEPVIKVWSGHLLPFPEAMAEKASIGVENAKGVRCLALDRTESRLAGGIDGNSRPCIVTLETSQAMSPSSPLNIHKAVRDITWIDENIVAFVSHSGYLSMVDLRISLDELVYNQPDPFQAKFYCMKTDGANAIVVGTSEHSRCVLYDIRNDRKHVNFFYTQKRVSPVYSLDFDSTKLFTAADLSIYVLDFNIKMTQCRDIKDYSEVVFQR